MRWPEHLHRKTFVAVLVADVVLMPLATYLASIDVKSWWIAGPMLVLNLPAIPLEIVILVFGGDDLEPSSSKLIAVCSIVAMYGITAIISSWGWSLFARRVFRGC